MYKKNANSTVSENSTRALEITNGNQGYFFQTDNSADLVHILSLEQYSFLSALHARILCFCLLESYSDGNKVIDKEFAENEKDNALNMMDSFARGGLRCLAFGYREFEYEDIVWEKNADTNVEEPAEDFVISEDITFLGERVRFTTNTNPRSYFLFTESII